MLQMSCRRYTPISIHIILLVHVILLHQDHEFEYLDGRGTCIFNIVFSDHLEILFIFIEEQCFNILQGPYNTVSKPSRICFWAASFA